MAEGAKAAADATREAKIAVFMLIRCWFTWCCRVVEVPGRESQRTLHQCLAQTTTTADQKLLRTNKQMCRLWDKDPEFNTESGIDQRNCEPLQRRRHTVSSGYPIVISFFCRLVAPAAPTGCCCCCTAVSASRHSQTNARMIAHTYAHSLAHIVSSLPAPAPAPAASSNYDAIPPYRLRIHHQYQPHRATQ